MAGGAAGDGSTGSAGADEPPAPGPVARAEDTAQASRADDAIHAQVAGRGFAEGGPALDLGSVVSLDAELTLGRAES